MRIKHKVPENVTIRQLNNFCLERDIPVICDNGEFYFVLEVENGSTKSI